MKTYVIKRLNGTEALGVVGTIRRTEAGYWFTANYFGGRGSRKAHATALAAVPRRLGTVHIVKAETVAGALTQVDKLIDCLTADEVN